MKKNDEQFEEVICCICKGLGSKFWEATPFNAREDYICKICKGTGTVWIDKERKGCYSDMPIFLTPEGRTIKEPKKCKYLKQCIDEFMFGRKEARS